MKNVACVIAFMIYAPQSLFAQEVEVKRFIELSEIQMVSTQRVDANGVVCALVRVVVPSNEGALFQGNVIGETVYKGNEYLVYMSEGSRYLRVHYPNCETLMVDFKKYNYHGLKSKRVYELVLELPYRQGLNISQKEYLQSQYILGVHYFKNKDFGQAARHFQIGAQSDNVDAQYGLAICYINTRNYVQAVPWLEKAAKQNHVDAQCDLGIHYFNNSDYVNAILWLSKSADGGCTRAMHKLSECYRKGLGVEQDASLAEEWEAKAKQVVSKRGN